MAWDIVNPNETSEQDLDFIYNGTGGEPAASPAPEPASEPAEEGKVEDQIEQKIYTPVQEGIQSIDSEEDFDAAFSGEEGEEEEPEAPADETEKPTEEKKTPGRPKKETKPSVNADLLRAGAEFLSAEFNYELPEGVTEWNEETFPELLKSIAEGLAEETYTSLKTSNSIAEAILDVLENDGDETALLSLFKEQRKFNNIDTSTPQGKLNKIVSWYKDVEGKSDAWINRNIVQPLSAGDDTTKLEEEFNEVNQQYDDYVDKQKNQQIEQAKREKSRREQILGTQRQNLEKVLTTTKVAKADIAKTLDYVYNDKAWRLTSTGQTISSFDKDILEAKQNPDVMADLQLFLRDKAKYNEKIITEASNKRTENVFKQKFNQPKPNRSSDDIESPKPKKFEFKF